MGNKTLIAHALTTNTDGCTVKYFTSRRRLVTLAMMPACAEQPKRVDIRGSELSESHTYQEADLNVREKGSEVKAANLGSDDAPASNRRVLRARNGIADAGDRSRSSSRFSQLCDGDDQDKQCPDGSESIQTAGKSARLRKRLERNQSAFTYSFFGFIENPMDALLVIEGCVRSNLRQFTGSAADMARIPIRSGTVIVIPENSVFVKRWRDGIHWSPSRAFGPFLLYR
ncbi:Gti1/Pac2 family-domain-containing protein [Chytriomyces cf. hyalinus JEL632]|nr:Gti1/Pac2 family-domain-containing protein [Chytriomyces cf. hyalinus JEL632]